MAKMKKADFDAIRLGSKMALAMRGGKPTPEKTSVGKKPKELSFSAKTKAEAAERKANRSFKDPVHAHMANAMSKHQPKEYTPPSQIKKKIAVKQMSVNVLDHHNETVKHINHFAQHDQSASHLKTVNDHLTHLHNLHASAEQFMHKNNDQQREQRVNAHMNEYQDNLKYYKNRPDAIPLHINNISDAHPKAVKQQINRFFHGLKSSMEERVQSAHSSHSEKRDNIDNILQSNKNSLADLHRGLAKHMSEAQKEKQRTVHPHHAHLYGAPRKKTLLQKIGHRLGLQKEEYGAGEIGTDELIQKYKAVTPGEEPNPKVSTISLIKKLVKERSNNLKKQIDPPAALRRGKRKADQLMKKGIV